MSAIYEVPLTPIAQQFLIRLGDRLLTLAFRWRNLGGSGWVMDVADELGVPYVNGLPLVTGADLLGQHRHLGIPGSFYVLTDGPSGDDDPTFTNLGINSHLYWISP